LPLCAQAINALTIIAKTFGGRSVSDIMAPHCDVLADMIPPRKHLLRHQPVNTQIGLVDGNTFCNSLRPRIFTLDLEVKEHKVRCAGASFKKMQSKRSLWLPVQRSVRVIRVSGNNCCSFSFVQETASFFEDA